MKNELMPAFPIPKGADGTIIGFNNPQNSEDFIKAYQPGFGLTKLGHFAGLAMQGIVASLSTQDALNMFSEAMRENKLNRGEHDILIAQNSVQYAKALIAELEKHQ